MNISNNEKAAYYANSVIGIVGGYSTYKYLPGFLKQPYLKFCLNKNKNISSLEHNQYWDSAIQAYRNSDCFNSELTITHIDKYNWKTIAKDVIQKRKETIAADSKKYPFIKLLAKIFCGDDNFIQQKIKTVAQGKNASFLPFASQIIVNKDKMGITTFHEIGHSINSYEKGWKKFLENSRVLSILSLPLILSIGLLTPKRKEGDEYKNPAGKTATFIKEHCGVLAGLSMLPIIIEEGTASINGAKLAKTVLDKNMYKKLNKYNARAFGSYISGSVILGICTALAVYIKDKVSGTKPVKNKD